MNQRSSFFQGSGMGQIDLFQNYSYSIGILFVSRVVTWNYKYLPRIIISHFKNIIICIWYEY